VRGRSTVGSRSPYTRLKLPARVDCGMNLSSARRSLSAVRWASYHRPEGDQ
jgi:hypothetical protein